MIDFVKELDKFQPILKSTEVTEAISDSDTEDITDILREIIKNIRNVKKSDE